MNNGETNRIMLLVKKCCTNFTKVSEKKSKSIQKECPENLTAYKGLTMMLISGLRLFIAVLKFSKFFLWINCSPNNFHSIA